MSKELQMVFQVDKVTRSKLRRPIEEMKHILATDVGSTTKARFSQRKEAKGGEVKRFKLGEKQMANVRISPARHFDVGEGDGKEVTTKVEGGTVGVILDGRGRLLRLPDGKGGRGGKLIEWFTSLDMYPEKYLGECG